MKPLPTQSDQLESLQVMPPSWRFLQPLKSGKCRVLFAGPHFQAGLASIKALLGRSKDLCSRIELIHAPTKAEVMAAAPTADIAIPFMEHFDRDFIRAAAPRLRLIQQFGVGLERVDMEEATNQGVAVSNVPAIGSGNAESTAEHALMLTMMLLRYAKVDLPRRFQQRQLGGLPLPRTILGKNVTVVGYGHVGSTLCSYLIHMGANVTAIRNRKWCHIEDADVVAKKLPCIKQALPTTDILILACTVTPATWHLVDKEKLSLLKDGAIVVNIGRGPLVEYSAILDALKSGKVGGFASDVGISHESKPSEPWDPEDELSKMDNVIFSPHVAGYCDESYGEDGHISAAVFEGIRAVINCEPPPVWVNKPQSDVWRPSDPLIGAS